MPLFVPRRVRSPLAASEPFNTRLSAVKLSVVAPPQFTVELVVSVLSDEAVSVVVPERVVVVLLSVVVAPKEIRTALAESVMSLPRTRKSPLTSKVCVGTMVPIPTLVPSKKKSSSAPIVLASVQ